MTIIDRLAAPLALLLFATPSLITVSHGEETRDAQIQIDANQRLGNVKKLIFGQNIEAADSNGIFGQTQKDKILTGDGFWLPAQGKPSDAILQKARDIGTSLLRYPGGCLAHNWDWRKSVGPKAERGDWQFGLDEYLQVCEKIGAEPMITISDYVLPAAEMPQHAAELVEYLNAPASPQHPWAVKRAEWGRKEPYKVRWFELGNESNHGNHDVVPRRQFSPDGYANYANATMKAMRAVDPSIQIGIVTEAGGPPESQWNKIILGEAGKNADFIVVHHYPGGIGRPPAQGEEELSYAAAFSVADQIEHLFSRYRKQIAESCGKDVPIAVTEFNNNMKGDKPKAYRFTLAGALVAADAVRVFLKPDTGIFAANFWQMFYGYFGPVRVDLKSAGEQGDYATEDLGGYWMFRLWAQHFGDELVKVTVQSPKQESPGLGHMPPAVGTEFKPQKLLREISPRTIKLDKFTKPGAVASLSEDGVLTVDLKEFAGNFYPEIMFIPRPSGVGAEGCDYELDYEARYIAEPGSEGASLCLGMGDARGWEATQSAVAVTGVDGPQWREISGAFRTQPDAPGINLLVRLEPGGNAVSGKLEIRNIRLRAISKPSFPAFDTLTATASLSADGKKLYLIVFNKSLNQSIQTKINVVGFAAKSARRWEVNGASAGAIAKVQEVVSGEDLPLEKNSTSLVLPPHSMSAFEFE
jgi:alpha-N-arabinofuranosidase